MKYCRYLLILVVAVLSIVPSGVGPAHAGGSVTYTGTFTDGHQSDFYGFSGGAGGHVTLTMVSITGCGSPDTVLSVTGPDNSNFFNDDSFIDGCPLNSHLDITLPVTGHYTVEARSFCQCSGDNGSYVLTISGDINISSGLRFDPGDNRVDPRANDRVAVWCNTTANPPNVVVYGIGDMKTNNSGGFYMRTFNYADLLAAGRKGITKDGGRGNGTISMMTDGKGHFYTAWNGGLFNATGLSDFSKSFKCDFSAVTTSTK